MVTEQSVSPNTMMILDRLKNIQMKAQRDDMNMQRIKREQRMVAEAGNLMKCRNLFGPSSSNLDITGVSSDNILMAPNVFTENPDNNILKKRRYNILSCKEAGNSLFF
jgi:hypothetical protein